VWRSVRSRPAGESGGCVRYNPPVNTRVETQFGVLEGAKHPTHLAFLGVRYAAPPLAALRFLPPAPPETFAGVREAKTFGPSSLQGMPFAPGLGTEGAADEDCLYLNVFTRALGARKRPVLFWIHGGAYTVGSAGVPLYDGGPSVALGDVVLVTHNYRLGAFGFLDLGDAGEQRGAVPNGAILDHIAALTWVRNNIEHFGGDPDNVTIFGESAGASSVAALLAAPAARSLFQRAIAQSPGLYPRLPTRARAAETTRLLFAKLELALGDVERLRALPAAQINAAQRAIETEGLGWNAFFPVRHALSLPHDPVDALALDGAAKKPLIVGSNRDEWNLFDAANVARWDQPLARADMLARLTKLVPGLRTEQAASVVDIYERSRKARGMAHHERALLRAIEGDLRFRMAAVRLAEMHTHAEVPVYAYMFTYESPALRGALGACHALELPFVFGTYREPIQERFAGSGPGVVALSDTLMRTWISFAERGAPSQLADFRQYDLEQRPTMLFDLETKLGFDPLGEERAAWDGVL
jgi:para-nitrobenzyl esterase